MCFVLGKTEEERIEHIADKDIITYKIMSTKKKFFFIDMIISIVMVVKSWYYMKKYRAKDYHNNFLTRLEVYDDEINPGFHSFTNLERTRNIKNNSYAKKSYIMCEAKTFKTIIVECIIPKGTPYYINNYYDDEIVSLDIKFNKILDDMMVESRLLAR